VLDQNGAAVENFTYANLQVHARLYYNPVISNWSGAVVVDTQQPVSLAVTQQNLSPFRAAAFSGVNQSTGDAYIPYLHKNNAAWSSNLLVQNTKNGTANLTVEFKAVSGTSCTQNYSIAAYGQITINLDTVSCVGSSFMGAARLTSTQPLAVAVTTRNTAQTLIMETTNSVGPAAGAAYLPRLPVEQTSGGWTSGLSLQNVSSSARTLSATYYKRSGTVCSSANYPNIGAYFPYVISPPFPALCATTIT
jgi:hypothetical protein